MSINWDTVFTIIARWIAAGSGLANGAVVWAGQGGSVPKDSSDVPYPIWISANLITTSSVGEDQDRYELAYLELDDADVSEVDADANTLTIAGHEYTSGDGPVHLTTDDTMPGGLAIDTDYWVVVVDASTIKLTASRAAAIAEVPSAFVEILDEGVGTVTISTVEDETTRPLEDIEHTTEGHRAGTLSLQCFASEAIGANRAQATLERVRAAYRLLSQQLLLKSCGVAVAMIEPATVRGGSTSSASAVEPRAVMQVQLNYVDGATEKLPSIEDVEIEVEVST